MNRRDPGGGGGGEGGRADAEGSLTEGGTWEAVFTEELYNVRKLTSLLIMVVEAIRKFRKS